MALSPELKRMVSGAQTSHGLIDPLAAKRAEIIAQMAEAEREVDTIDWSLRQRLEWLGLQKATKQELREIIVKAMERDPEA